MADGDGSHVRAVPQIPVEYDDLYMTRNTDRDFSLDINSRMTVPSRLSVGGNSLHELEVDNMRSHDSVPNRTVSNMAIPNHITLTGQQDETRVLRESPFDVPQPAVSSDIHITTPPRVLRADTDFPAVQEEEETVVITTNQEQFNEQLRNAMKEKNLFTAPAETQANRLTLEQRIVRLEQRESSRHTRELIVYPLVAIYFFYQLSRWWR